MVNSINNPTMEQRQKHVKHISNQNILRVFISNVTLFTKKSNNRLPNIIIYFKRREMNSVEIYINDMSVQNRSIIKASVNNSTCYMYIIFKMIR